MVQILPRILLFIISFYNVILKILPCVEGRLKSFCADSFSLVIMMILFAVKKVDKNVIGP